MKQMYSKELRFLEKKNQLFKRKKSIFFLYLDQLDDGIIISLFFSFHDIFLMNVDDHHPIQNEYQMKTDSMNDYLLLIHYLILQNIIS